MIIQGTTRTRCANAEHAEAPLEAKGPSASFRKVYETTERKAHDAGPTLGRSELAPPPTLFTGTDAEAFEVFVEANRRTESGGVAAFSMLCTTAGAEHRASYGVAQLTMREHLSRMAQLDDRALREFGTSHADIDAMSARGDAAISYYHLLVDGGAPETTRSALRLTREQAERAAELAGAGDVAGLRAMLGRDFAGATGLPESALAELVATRGLRSRALRRDFRAQYEHDHDVAFDPSDRDPTRMTITARHVALSHPELGATVRALGTDDAGALALGHYLGVGDVAENMLGWHARAASTAVGEARFAQILAAADPLT